MKGDYVIVEEKLNNIKGDYIIVGDLLSGNRVVEEDVLVRICGNKYEDAYETLNRMNNNPTKIDKGLMQGHKNFKIGFVEEKDCWWNDYEYND